MTLVLPCMVLVAVGAVGTHTRTGRVLTARLQALMERVR